MDFWHETAEQYATPGSDMLWAEMNTFPMIRVTITGLTPAQAGTEVVNRVTAFFEAVADIWPAAKAKKWILLLMGPDGQGQNTMYVAANPGDYLPLQLQSGGPDVYRVGLYHDATFLQQGLALETEA